MAPARTTDAAVAAACAAALCESVLFNDAGLAEAAVDVMPPLPYMVDLAGALLRASAYASAQIVVSRREDRDADKLDIAYAWHDSMALLAQALVHVHGYAERDVGAFLHWATDTLLDQHAAVPDDSHGQARLVALASALTAEIWLPWGRARWRAFLRERDHRG